MIDEVVFFLFLFLFLPPSLSIQLFKPSIRDPESKSESESQQKNNMIAKLLFTLLF